MHDWAVAMQVVGRLRGLRRISEPRLFRPLVHLDGNCRDHAKGVPFGSFESCKRRRANRGGCAAAWIDCAIAVKLPGVGVEAWR
jgi:hypothetical protein